MSMLHNHRPNWGIPVSGCPRCEELREFPYVVKFKLNNYKRIQRLPARSVRHAIELIKAQLPAEALSVPIVETPSGDTVAILRYEALSD